MFETKYREAYDSVRPSQEVVCELLCRAEEAQKSQKKDGTKALYAVGAAMAAFLCIFSVLPVCAAKIPAFYRVVEYISPALADSLVPVERSSSSKGITMEVEAVNMEGNEAEIIVSVRDEEGSGLDQIHGPVDLFDSYELSGFGSEQITGGCNFLVYDEETGRAYFKITVQSSNRYGSDKFQFSVREILCNKTKESQEIDLSGIGCQADTKRVSLHGMGGMGMLEEDSLPDSLKAAQDAPEWQWDVLDLMRVEDCAEDDFTVTGAAYMDGALRLQICMGNNRHADRHVQTLLVDVDGNERDADLSVSWNEEMDDLCYQFYEYYFIGELEEIKNSSMYGIFHNSGESVEGKWDVTFRIE